MPDSSTALATIQDMQQELGLRWVNTGRVSEDWKAKIFENQLSKLQIALYNRSTSITVLLEHDIQPVLGLTKLSHRPGGGAVNVAASKFAKLPGSCYAVESTRALENLLRIYFEKPKTEVSGTAMAPDNFYVQVQKAISDTAKNRQARLKIASPIPTRVVTQVTAFVRNPDVVAEVLFRAAGNCEGCGKSAPFRRVSDGTPYLEVHHNKPLSMNGEDTVTNAIGLCPNCHRRSHFGPRFNLDVV